MCILLNMNLTISVDRIEDPLEHNTCTRLTLASLFRVIYEGVSNLPHILSNRRNETGYYSNTNFPSCMDHALTVFRADFTPSSSRSPMLHLK
jgi:hypothetical protein